MKSAFSTFIALLLCCQAMGQGQPIGYWRSLLPYNSSTSIARDGNKIYTATGIALFSYNTLTGETVTYSKVEGMSDVNTSYLGFDDATSTLIVGYTNGNIDLLKDNSFYNIPSLKLKQISGTKNINHIYTNSGYAYLSTDIGVLVINLTKREVKETYSFSQNGTALKNLCFTEEGNYFYTATDKGLYRASITTANLQSSAAWKLIGGTSTMISVASKNGKVLASTADSVYLVSGDTLKPIIGLDNITATSISNLYLYICHGTQNSNNSFANANRIYKLSLDSLKIADTINVYSPLQIVEENANEFYVAAYQLINFKGRNETQVPVPGPHDYGAFGIYAKNEEVWVAHGSYNDLYQEQYHKSGFSILSNNTWRYYDYYSLDTIQDIVTIAQRPADKSMWIGSMQTGLMILYPDGTHKQLYKDTVFENIPRSDNIYPINSIVPDEEGNMWVTNSRSPHELRVYTKDGYWYSYAVNFAGDSRNLAHSADNLVIDDAGQKWFHPDNSPSMVIMYNNNKTLSNTADDQVVAYSSGNGMPGSITYCLVKDKNGALWAGTDAGIAIINSPETALQGTTTVETPIVQYDEFPGYLFQTEQVYTMAVDGANRKWIGTGNGVWLISETGDKIIYRYTISNSPLPSNRIRKISIDPVTGDVYIGTDLGLVSFRSTATTGGTVNNDVLVFPNPVTSKYSGTIAIRGLVDEADVRITDIAGQLVYRTTALGGQAVWSGLDYTGKRPQSGVYLIYATNKDGTQTHIGKMVFME